MWILTGQELFVLITALSSAPRILAYNTCSVSIWKMNKWMNKWTCFPSVLGLFEQFIQSLHIHLFIFHWALLKGNIGKVHSPGLTHAHGKCSMKIEKKKWSTKMYTHYIFQRQLHSFKSVPANITKRSFLSLSFLTGRNIGR